MSIFLWGVHHFLDKSEAGERVSVPMAITLIRQIYPLQYLHWTNSLAFLKLRPTPIPDLTLDLLSSHGFPIWRPPQYLFPFTETSLIMFFSRKSNILPCSPPYLVASRAVSTLRSSDPVSFTSNHFDIQYLLVILILTSLPLPALLNYPPI